MNSPLKRYYLKDSKLAQHALLEFHRALSTGRMIAFTGAMTTEACGYGDWGAMLEAYRAAAVESLSFDHLKMSREADCADDERIKHINDIAYFYGAPANSKMDRRVAYSLFEEVVGGKAINLESLQTKELESKWPSNWPWDEFEDRRQLLKILMARSYRTPKKPDGVFRSFAEHDVLRAISESLGISRVATLSFDMEFEQYWMQPDKRGTDAGPFQNLQSVRGKSLEWDLGSGRIRCVLPNGQAVESDLLNRERIDRLFEFAIGSDDVDRHIMHLHGRACTPPSMILSYRDYDRLYRRNDLHKLPFEHAQRTMIGGNPILFIGIGMGEPEVNRTLEDFISNSPYQRAAPTFLIWNYDKANLDDGDRERIRRMRLDWLHRLGVLTIFDTDLWELQKRTVPETGQPATDRDALRRALTRAERTLRRCRRALVRRQFKPLFDQLRKRPVKPANTAQAVRIANLKLALEKLVSASKDVAKRESWNPEEFNGGCRSWRSMAEKIQSDAPSIFWRKEGQRDPEFPFERGATAFENELERARDAKYGGGSRGRSPNLTCIIGPTGCGKGSLESVAVGLNRIGIPKAAHF